MADPYAPILAEARAAAAAGTAVDEEALSARIRALGGGTAAERRALAQLGRIAAVRRARARLAEPPSATAPQRVPRPRPALLRARPTISANMEVRREGGADAAVLAWERAPGVESWEVRVSERPSSRGDYVVRETRTLPGTATSTEVPLGERPLRVHLLGRGRDGRLVRRAVVSALTRESWGERWQRRASAS